MGAKIRVYRQKISSTQSMKKIFKAMEMIATSRINKARGRLNATLPYSNAMTRLLAAVLEQTSGDNPFLLGEQTPRRSAVVVFSSDRGLAGSYSANVLKQADRLLGHLNDRGKEAEVYLVGRKAKQYFDFRSRAYRRVWEGDTDSASPERAQEIADTLLEAFATDFADGGIEEVLLVFTEFESMVTQTPVALRLLPLEVSDANKIDDEVSAAHGSIREDRNDFEFEPDADEFLSQALPAYFRARVFSAMCHAAASELASRQRAMKAAGDNADDLIKKYTRLMNNARQAEVTTELSEIVSASEAL